MNEATRPRCPTCGAPNAVGQSVCMKCGATLPGPWTPAPTKLASTGMTHRNAALVALVGGAMMAIGSFMPWLTARTGLGSISVSGTDGDGVFTLGVGVVVGLIALVHLERPASTGVKALIVLAGVIGGIVAVLDLQNVNERIANIDTEFVAASVGAGLYVLAIGSVATIVGGWRMYGRIDERV